MKYYQTELHFYLKVKIKIILYVFLSVVLNLVVERKSESQLAQVNM